MSLPAAVYRPRNPQYSDYCRCVEDYFETFVSIYDEHFSRRYGLWRPYLEKVVYRHLDCGDPHNGFARVKCKDCDHEYLLAFSCKRRHFCPSCHQKRVFEFGEWLCMDVLKNIPHRHFIFSIPKILRRYFLYNRKLLADLCIFNVKYPLTGENSPLMLRASKRKSLSISIIKAAHGKNGNDILLEVPGER